MPKIDLWELRQELEKGIPRGGLRIHIRRLKMRIPDYINKRCKENKKWCPKCESWVEHEGFNRDSGKYDKCASWCRRCANTRRRAYSKTRRSGYKYWTKEDKATFYRMLGKYEATDIGKVMGR